MLERLENPVFRQSSLQRMRGARTYGCLLGYLTILALVVVVAYEQFMNIDPQRSTTGLAQTLFDTLTVTQWFLVALVTPALTASAVTREREQRTIDLLIITPLSRFAIVWGKFLSALAFSAVLILCGLPLVAVLFLMGGLDVTAMLVRYAAMLISAALLAAYGLMMSAVCGTSTLATLLTYFSVGSVYMFGAMLGVAWVASSAFGGSMTVFGSLWMGLPAWQVWTLVLVAVGLSLALLLQIAANYLLPDPRMGAWKTRLITALLYLWVLAGTVLVVRSGTTPVTGRNILCIVCLFLLWEVAAAVATGVPLRGKKWYEWLHPRALGVGTVQTSLVYLWLLLAAAAVLDMLLVPPANRSTLLAWGYAAGFLWWLWALGYLCSSLVSNRWGAAVALIGSLTVYAQAVITLSAIDPTRFGVLDTLVNLASPIELFEMGVGAGSNSLVLWTVLYPVFGLIAALLAVWLEAVKERRGKRQSEVHALAGTGG